MKSETRAAIKSILDPLGLGNAARGLRDRWTALHERWVLARHRDQRIFSTRVGGAELRFRLDDPYSREWFLPRYAGGRLHERTVTLLMAEHFRSARCFADVGTNLGWFTCLAGVLMPEGRVYGFEMDEQNLELLRGNLELNGCENAIVHHAAVSDAPGEVRYRSAARTPSSVLRIAPDSAGSAGDEIAIRAVSLDSVFANEPRAPDVVKIDVEGAEMQVLRGAERVLEAAPVLFVEIHPQNLPEFGSSASEVLGFLHERGYRVSEIVDLREQRRDARLRPLAPGAGVERNCMVYARREA